MKVALVVLAALSIGASASFDEKGEKGEKGYVKGTKGVPVYKGRN